MRLKHIIISAVTLLAILMVYLLWPLASDRYDIEWDKDLISQKRQFLDYRPVGQVKKDQPNILLIIVDDLSKTDTDLYTNGRVNTPNIDQLGKEGVIFDQAYVTSSVCSPSRAAILTGRYPQRYGFTYQMHDFYPQNRLTYFGFKYFVDSYPWVPRKLGPVPSPEATEKEGLPPSEIVLPELLKKEGYTTGLVGKWHLGYDSGNIPCQFGFDYQYGFYASHSLYAPEGSEGIVDQKIEKDFSDKYIWKGQRNGPHAIYRNCNEIEEKEYLTNAITRECISFIENNQDTSFFLIASYNAPHTPLQAPEKYVRKFDHVEDPVKRVYYAMISSLDDNIGKLVGSLKEMGLYDDTMIFFISDNGGATYTYTTDNAPLRGGKITDFEGGINVPMIFTWKNQIPGGNVYPHPVVSMDIFTTIVDQLDIKLPADRVYDGVDLVPFVLSSNKNKLPHKFLYWNRGNTRAIRSKDYKLLYHVEFGDTLLFDMRKDNLERENIYSKNNLTAVKLLREYDEWYHELPDPLWPPMVYYFHKDRRTGETFVFDN